MSDHRFTDINDDPSDAGDEPSQAELDAITRILGDSAVWDEPDPGVEDLVVAAILAEAEASRSTDSSTGEAGPTAAPSIGASTPDDAPARDREGSQPSEPSPQPPPAPPSARGKVIDARSRFRPVGIVLAAAAVVAVVVISWGVTRSSEPDRGQLVALAPTDLAPTDAQGELEINARPGGTQIFLDVEGLPPAPNGSYYEAWLRKSPEVGVSVGTFHLRGGDTKIELWGGVSADDYPIFTVTLQKEGEGAASSGEVVLSGLVEDN